MLQMPDGGDRFFEMTGSSWTAFDDLMASGHTACELIAWAIDEFEHDPAHSLDAWLTGVVMQIHRERREDERQSAAFHQFCASQPQDAEGLRRIEAEAERLKVQRAADRRSQ